VVERALELHRQGAIAEAEQVCLEALELAPTQLDALSLLYQIRKAGNVERAADVLLRRIVALHPNTFWALNQLALALFNKGAALEAEVHARNAVRIAPENPQSHYLMGMVMTEARALYRESVAAAPEILQTLLGWARLEEADRNLDAAAELLDRAERVAPNNPSVSLARAVVQGRNRSYDKALQILDQAATQNRDRSLDANELLEKGRLLDRLGRYEEAFAAFEEGKRLCREVSGLQYLADHARQQAERLRGFFTEGRLAILPRALLREDMPQPLFILGFPRSGTTLVEQTLSAHPRIVAGDELPFVNEITAAMVRVLNSPMTYPEALAELWMGDRREGLDELRDYYLAGVRRLGILEPGAAWFTDKMPLNEMHLGLIALMFPRSPIIHVLRHPLDVVLSVFSNHLTHGFYCSFALETAARHYALVMELVEHYRGQMTLRYLPIRYEDIVADQEGSTRRMLDFIGEEFDERCIEFHENRRYARTASYAQVTEPLYDTSRFRYRHYLKQLEPVIPILEPFIKRLGYPLA
jgi:tetratricopeptide (TPR) repeat protein